MTDKKNDYDEEHVKQADLYRVHIRYILIISVILISGTICIANQGNSVLNATLSLAATIISIILASIAIWLCVTRSQITKNVEQHVSERKNVLLEKETQDRYDDLYEKCSNLVTKIEDINQNLDKKMSVQPMDLAAATLEESEPVNDVQQTDKSALDPQPEGDLQVEESKINTAEDKNEETEMSVDNVAKENAVSDESQTAHENATEEAIDDVTSQNDAQEQDTAKVDAQDDETATSQENDAEEQDADETDEETVEKVNVAQLFAEDRNALSPEMRGKAGSLVLYAKMKGIMDQSLLGSNFEKAAEYYTSIKELPLPVVVRSFNNFIGEMNVENSDYVASVTLPILICMDVVRLFDDDDVKGYIAEQMKEDASVAK